MEEKTVWSGDKLEQAMAQKGLSVNALYKKTGIWRSSIATYLSGESVPGADTVGALADGVGCSVEYFFVQKLVGKQTNTNE